VVLAPPFTALAAAAEATRGSSVRLAAQDLYWESDGAYTGEVSAAMVAEFAPYVIVGHSERRAIFGETDATVNRKAHAAFGQALVPILCVGETAEERRQELTDSVIERQLRLGLDGLAQTEAAHLVLAYEPVWAIGTGLACDPVEAQRVIGSIRAWLSGAMGREPACEARLLYGGSVNAANAAGYLAEADIDGALVGGASLDAAGFAAIVKAAR
jgi:triosephosphate isomerase